MEIYLLILIAIFFLLFAFLIYIGIRLKKTLDRIDSILGVLNENTPQIMEELKLTLKGIRAFAEDLNPVKEDIKEVGKTLVKVAALFDLLTPDPKGLKALKDGVGTFVSSIFSSIFSHFLKKPEEKKHTEKEEHGKNE